MHAHICTNQQKQKQKKLLDSSAKLLPKLFPTRNKKKQKQLILNSLATDRRAAHRTLKL